MSCPHGCGYIDGVHDYGCEGRRTAYTDPRVGELYLTETPVESNILDLALQKLLDQAGMAEWDPEQVVGGDPEWLAVRQAIREGIQAHEQLPVRIEWSDRAEAPALVMRR